MTQTSRTTAGDIVLEFHRRWTGGEVDQAMTLVADDVVCHAPGHDLIGKDAYRNYLAGFAPDLTGLTDVASFARDDQVALFYHPHTSVTTSAPAAECFTVRDGVIAENLLVFDRLSFAPPSRP